MNEDKLKKFIDQHREEFETERPHRMVWQNIEHQLHTSGRTRSLWNIIPMIYKIAASGLILISLGVGIGFKVQQQKDFTYAIQNPDSRKEFREAEAYYTSQIDNKLNELNSLQPGSSIMEDLSQIDQISTELKLELLKNPDQDQSLLIQQMMHQYQQKLEVLNKILSKTQQKDNKKPLSPNTKPDHDTLQL